MVTKAKYNSKYGNPVVPGKGDSVWSNGSEEVLEDAELERLAPKEWPATSLDSKEFTQFAELEKGTAPDRG